MHNFRSIFVIGLLSLTACGGGESDTSKTSVDNTASAIEVTPNVDLTGQPGTLLPSAKKVAGVTSNERATISNSFSNALGSIRHSGANDNVQGNITLGVTASDEDQLQKVSLFLPEVNRTFTLCDNNCTASFNSTITGFNPQLANVTAGPLRIELIVEDGTGNSVVVDALNINWQPIQISSLSATRENNTISIAWSGDSNLQRYNLYAATKNTLNVTNVLSLDNGFQLLAINGTSAEFADLDSSKYYHVLIAGVDEGGESGLSSLLSIPRSNSTPNLPPIANNDVFSVNEDSTLIVNVLGNDQDPEEQLLTLNGIVQQPVNGLLTIDEFGALSYTPQVNFHGVDTARYQVMDSEGGLSEGVVSFEVSPINDDPIASDDVFGVDINGQVNSQNPEQVNNLLLNDSDIDGDELFVVTTLIEGPDFGVVTINSDGSFFYSATDVLLKVDQFVYQISDNNGGTSQATVSILPNVELLSPLAKNDVYQVNEDSTLLISDTGNGILANDADPNGFDFTLENILLIQPQHGQLNLSMDGTFSYVPDSDFFGVDQFQYQIKNTANIASTAFVTINVNKVSDIPIALDDNYQINEDETLIVDELMGLLGNDIDLDNELLTASIVSSPISGSINLAGNGSFSYLPSKNFNGVDSFTYQITNEGGLSTSANVSIIISAVNDAPTAVTDNIMVNEDSTVIFDVLANDSDSEGSNLTLVSAQIQNVTTAIINNSLSISPTANFFGTLTGNYTVSDSTGATSLGNIIVTVNPVNDVPVANNDSFNVRENEILNISTTQTLLNNDVDVDGDVLSVSTTPITNVNNGVLILNSNGTFTYTPTSNFDGTDTFTYQVTDSKGATSQADVIITVINTVTPNVSPVAVNDSYTINEGDSLSITNVAGNHLLINDSDFENNALTVNTTPINNVNNGSLVLGNDGSFTYIPSVNFNGTDTFTYEINDGFGGTSQATATITINAINDVPIAIADAYILNEDSVLTKQISDVDNLLSNDSDIDGDTLSVNPVPISSVANGSLSLNSDGSFSYTPDADYFGADGFIYEISDGKGGIAQSSVDITILPINDAPSAINQAFNLDEDKTNGDVVGTILATDKESNNLSYTLTGGDTSLFDLDIATGVLTVQGANPLDYEISIQHSVTVTITDDGMPSPESTNISLTVNVIDKPEPVVLSEKANFGRPLTGFIELTGIKTQAKLTDSVRDGNKIYFVGSIDNVDKDIYVIAYNKNGKLDSGFGSGGIKTFDFGNDEYAASIIEQGGDYYIAFNSDDGTHTEACFLKIDNDADLVTSFGVNGVRCTTEKSNLFINDLAFNSKDIFAVGKVQASNNNLLIIQMDKDGNFIDHTPSIATDSPHIIQDVSGQNLDDEGMAIYNSNGKDVLVAGNVQTSVGDKDMFAWLLDENGVAVSSFNGGNANFYDVIGSHDEVNAIGGKKENNFTAYLVGSTILANGQKEALIVAIDDEGEIDTGFGTNGVITYDIDGDSGAGTGYGEFRDLIFDSSTLFLTGTLFDGQNKQFATRVKTSNANIDSDDFASGGIKKINYSANNAFSQSISLDSHNTMWLSGYVESGADTNMIISAVDEKGDLCNDECTNDFSNGKETISHSSIASNDTAAGIIQIKFGAHQGKFLIASVANSNNTDYVMLSRATSAGVMDTSFSDDGHKQLQIGASATVKGLFELPTGKFIIYGNVTESNVTNGYLARLDEYGNFDTSFANNGIYTTSAISASSIQFEHATYDNSGRLIAVGNFESGSTRSFALRLIDSGTPDSGFNAQGYIIGDSFDEFTSVVVDAANNVYAAGNRDSFDKEMLVIKYTSGGSFDTSFNGTGVLTVDVNFLADDTVQKIAFDNNNNLYLIGNVFSLTQRVSVVKISATGQLDTSFSGNGIGTYNMAPLLASAGAYDAIIDNNNNVVVVGFAKVFGVNAEMIGRIKADGSLDSTFHNVGYYQANHCTNSARYSSVILLSNNALVVAGQCYIDGTYKNNIEFSQYQLN